MANMHKELICSLADIRYISIACQHCNTKVVLDLKEPTEIAKMHDNAMLPKACPGCRKEYDTALGRGLDSLQKAYGELKRIERCIGFSVNIDSGDIAATQV